MPQKLKNTVNSFQTRMKEVALFLKKDFIEQKFKFKKSERDIWGFATVVLLAVLFVAAVVYFVAKIVKIYCVIPLNGEAVPVLREMQILTLVYAVVFVINLIAGVGKIYSSIANASDVPILQVLPVSSKSIFLYKLFTVYLHQVVTCLLILLPINLTIGIVMGNDAGFYIGTAFSMFLMPIFSLLIASLIAIPANRVIQWFRSRYLVSFFLFLGVIFVGFWVYAQILKVLESLLSTGQMQFFFNESTLNLIEKISAAAYPVNMITGLILGQNVLANSLILAAAILISSIVVFFTVQKLVTKMLQHKLEGKTDKKRLGSKRVSQHSPMLSLIKKEGVLVVRTSSYAFQYLAVAIILPFMCYLSIGIVNRLLQSIVPAEAGFEVAVFVVAMFAMLTNTFCATNISRDGQMFQFMKTMPISGKTVLTAKVLFCSVISEVAIAASVIVLCVTGYVKAWEGVGVFIFVSVLSFAEILFATRLDLNHPKFPTAEDGELTESSSVSVIALVGLISAFLVGSVFVAVSLVLNVQKLLAIRPYVLLGISVVLSAIFLSAALSYFFIGLKKRYRGAK